SQQFPTECICSLVLLDPPRCGSGCRCGLTAMGGGRVSRQVIPHKGLPPMPGVQGCPFGVFSIVPKELLRLPLRLYICSSYNSNNADVNCWRMPSQTTGNVPAGQPMKTTEVYRLPPDAGLRSNKRGRRV